MVMVRSSAALGMRIVPMRRRVPVRCDREADRRQNPERRPRERCKRAPRDPGARPRAGGSSRGSALRESLQIQGAGFRVEIESGRGENSTLDLADPAAADIRR